jgi:hypothetical protein
VKQDDGWARPGARHVKLEAIAERDTTAHPARAHRYRPSVGGWINSKVRGKIKNKVKTMEKRLNG